MIAIWRNLSTDDLFLGSGRLDIDCCESEESFDPDDPSR